MSDRLAMLTIVWYKREYRGFLLIMVFLIDVTGHLGGSIRQYGTIMAVSPLAELITIPAAGLLALRCCIGRLFGLGLAVATIEYLIPSFSTALWQVHVTQAMDALVVAAVLGLGLTYAQQLSPGRAGLASSTYCNTVALRAPHAPFPKSAESQDSGRRRIRTSPSPAVPPPFASTHRSPPSAPR